MGETLSNEGTGSPVPGVTTIGDLLQTRGRRRLKRAVPTSTYLLETETDKRPSPPRVDWDQDLMDLPSVAEVDKAWEAKRAGARLAKMILCDG
jgi:hypothetical protein